MTFSTTYIATIVNVLAFLLPKFGINVGSVALTTTIQTLLVLGSGLVILYKRFQQGDIHWFGARKA